jgi:hypothetical protein
MSFVWSPVQLLHRWLYGLPESLQPAQADVSREPAEQWIVTAHAGGWDAFTVVGFEREADATAWVIAHLSKLDGWGWDIERAFSPEEAVRLLYTAEGER